MIRAMLWMIETHWAVLRESTMDRTTLAQIRIKTFIRSKGFILMNRLMDRLTEDTYVHCVYEQISALMDRAGSPYKEHIFHKL